MHKIESHLTHFDFNWNFLMTLAQKNWRCASEFHNKISFWRNLATFISGSLENFKRTHRLKDISTPDFSTPDFSTMNFSTPDFSTMNFWTMGLKSSWLNSLGLKSQGLKCPLSNSLTDISTLKFLPNCTKIHGGKVQGWKVHGWKIWGWKVRGWKFRGWDVLQPPATSPDPHQICG